MNGLLSVVVDDSETPRRCESKKDRHKGRV